MMPGNLSLISSSIDEKERGKAIGTLVIIHGYCYHGRPGFRRCFGRLPGFGVIFSLSIYLSASYPCWCFGERLAEMRSKGADRSIDFPGAAAIALGLASLTFGFLRAPGFEFWPLAGISVSLAAGILLLTLFIWIEAKSKHPMMPLDLFSNATFSGVNLLTFSFTQVSVQGCYLCH